MAKKVTAESVAILTIFDANGKCDIARWLRRQARFLTVHGLEMSSRFTARYIQKD
jgi:hypothetical protein